MGSNSTLAGRASRALAWSLTSTVLAKLGTFGIGIMLARLLGPHTFGTYAVAYVALRILTNLNDLGVSLAIVRWPGDPVEIAPTVTSISIISSIALYAGCFFGAPAYASAMGAPGATSVVRVLCLVVVADGIAATPWGLLERHFRQDLRMIADQVNVWLGTGVTAALAWSGFGAMSLALGRMVGCAAAVVLLLAFSPEPVRLGFDPAQARQLVRFGLPLAGSGVILFAVANVDQLVVGRVLGVTALGFFALACNLSNWPVTIFSQPVRSVAPATFSRLQHDPAAMRSGFLSVAGLLGAVTLPVCLVISGAATPLIGFIYGPRWLPATHALIWLSALAALQIFFELTYDYFVVLTRSRVVFTLQLAWIIMLVPALIAGAKARGISGLAMAELGVAAGFILPWYFVELHRVGVRGRALADRLWLPLAGGLLAGALSVAAASLAPNYLAAIVASALVGLLIIGLLVYRMRAAIASLRRLSGEQSEPGAMVSALDTTGPLPLYRDFTVGFTLDRDTSGVPTPLYRETVASLRWDPAATPHRGCDVACATVSWPVDEAADGGRESSPP